MSLSGTAKSMCYAGPTLTTHPMRMTASRMVSHSQNSLVSPVAPTSMQ